jgi:hypothetical protein
VKSKIWDHSREEYYLVASLKLHIVIPGRLEARRLSEAVDPNKIAELAARDWRLDKTRHRALGKIATPENE